MAFPTGYTLYQNVTIDNTQVDATLTDYPCFVDLSDMLKAGDDVFDTCRTDGGDIRVTLTDGTTQLAREIVSIDTTAKTGEMHVKIPSLASGTDTVIRVWYNGTDTEPAEGSTYGKENTWSSDYKMVQHMNDTTTSTITDSTANDSDGSKTAANDPIEVAGKIGEGQDFDGSGGIDVGGNDLGSSIGTMSLWINPDFAYSGTSLHTIFGSNGSTSKYLRLAYNSFSASRNFRANYRGNFGNIITAGSSQFASDITLHVDHKIDVKWNATNGTIELFRNGVSEGSDSDTVAAWGGDTDWNIGTGNLIGVDCDGMIDEVRMRSSEVSDDWISTEDNNQSSPSTFYSVGDEQGGGPTGRPLPQRVLSGPFSGPLNGVF